MEGACKEAMLVTSIEYMITPALRLKTHTLSILLAAHRLVSPAFLSTSATGM